MLETLEYIEKGGAIMYILIALNIVGFSVMLSKIIKFTLIKLNSKKLTEKIVNNSQNIDKNIDKLLKNELTYEIKKLESGLNTIKIIAQIAPLLGLLGTVIGVFNAFDTISEKGLEDASFFASGISLALITTVGGLIVAIPHYIGYNYLIGSIDKLEIKLEKELFKSFYERAV